MSTIIRIAFLTGLSLATLRVARADEQVTIELKPHWVRGEKFEYEFVDTTIKNEIGEADYINVARTPVVVEVIAAAEKGYVVRWRAGRIVYDDPKVAERPYVKAVARQFDGLTVDLVIGADGGYLGTNNWRELQAFNKKLPGEIVAELERAGLPQATLDALRNQAHKQYPSKPNNAFTFKFESSFLLLPLGKSYDSAKPTTTGGFLHNPFDGKSRPAKVEFGLKNYDPATGIATVYRTKKLALPEADTGRERGAEDLAIRLGKNPDLTTLLAIELSEETECVVDTKTGWVLSVSQVRRYESGTTMRTDSYTLQRREVK